MAVLAILALPREAQAVPSFAGQTGMSCTACHVGGFGPQLTPFGRAFKIGGYTQSGGDGLASKIPLSAMVLGSFTSTSSSFPPDQVPQHYNNNNNFSLDQISLFLAGRISDHTGGFIQGTWTDVDNTFNLDQVDLRPYTTTFDVHGTELRVGATINNAPTVTDPFNSTFAWGYPYVASALAPTPAAEPILAGPFIGNTIGVTGYLWWDRSLYVEAGGYQTMSNYTMSRFGVDYGVGQTSGVAPYIRAAYEWNWNNQSAHIGALFMQANTFPVSGVRQADPSNGTDGYTDLAIDGGYQFYGDGTNTVSAYGIYTHEWQNLSASSASFNNANGTAYGSNYGLNNLRIELSYWYQNTYGATIGWQKTWGPQNPVLYQPGEVYGSANSKPNSNAIILEADWVPFGKADSWGSPFANLKLGAQYTIYTQFNGGTSNYDGYGRSASGNNTLFLFAWLMF